MACSQHLFVTSCSYSQYPFGLIHSFWHLDSIRVRPVLSPFNCKSIGSQVPKRPCAVETTVTTSNNMANAMAFMPNSSNQNGSHTHTHVWINDVWSKKKATDSYTCNQTKQKPRRMEMNTQYTRTPAHSGSYSTAWKIRSLFECIRVPWANT